MTFGSSAENGEEEEEKGWANCCGYQLPNNTEGFKFLKYILVAWSSLEAAQLSTCITKVESMDGPLIHCLLINDRRLVKVLSQPPSWLLQVCTCVYTYVTPQACFIVLGHKSMDASPGLNILEQQATFFV